ncbi:MAG TPA: hypothetical protein VLH75_00905 [Longimicrobiales bacterium]|nr:hypothetical protein [Longimicrobiales bacterium]
MEHLNREALARLVDETPGPEETEHLATCLACRSELEALRAQTQALASLPEIRPPLGDWEVLEDRLRAEGLVQHRGLMQRLTLAQAPAWMRVAAAGVLFLGGSTMGAGLAWRPAAEIETASVPADDAAQFTAAQDVDDAAAAVRIAEANYISALTRYRQLLDAQGGSDVIGDPSSRFAALEYLVAAGQAAVRQAPADPFLNGLLASTMAEREATLRSISNRQDNWF